jgi:hypothetical protein
MRETSGNRTRTGLNQDGKYQKYSLGRIMVGSEESGELDFHIVIVRGNKRQVNVPSRKTMVFSKSRILTLSYTDFTERTDFFPFLWNAAQPCHPRDPCTPFVPRTTAVRDGKYRFLSSDNEKTIAQDFRSLIFKEPSSPYWCIKYVYDLSGEAPSGRTHTNSSRRGW